MVTLRNIVTITIPFLVICSFLSFLMLIEMSFQCYDKGRRENRTSTNHSLASAVMISQDPARFVFELMDDPFALDFASHDSRAIISSAIFVASKGIVAFVVNDRPNEIDANSLLEFRCAFSNEEATNQSSAWGEAPTAHLYLHANVLRFYKSATIWACPVPMSEKIVPKTVRIIPPAEKVNVAFGSGIFQVTIPHKYQSSPSLVSCGKTVHTLNNQTLNDIKMHYLHYSQLGVTHFTYYALQHDDSHEVLKNLLQDISSKSATASTIRLSLFPSSYALVHKGHKERYEELKRRYEDYTTNDCLYKSKTADWVLTQFDIDEFLVGTSSLSSFLSAQPESVKAIYVPHYIPGEDRFPLDETNHPVLNVSSEAPNDWGKTMYRPQFVDNAWVHAPVNPAVDWISPPELMLLHYRRNKNHMFDEFIQRNMTWVEISHPYAL